jgi:uncharacterized membrane protein YhhN
MVQCFCMLFLTTLSLLFINLFLLIRAVLKQDIKRIYIFKPFSTILILLICLLSLFQPNVNMFYTAIILMGLIFSLGGDIVLILPLAKAFFIGLLFFIMTHLIYGIGFTWFNGFFWQDAFSAAIIVLLSTIIYAYLYPSLEKVKLAVAFYVLIISFMVWRAVSVLFGTAFTPAQAGLIISGAILFYVADTLEAFYRFKNQIVQLRAIYLSSYYAGQLLIALSTFIF